jgi:hypothetical protein
MTSQFNGHCPGFQVDGDGLGVCLKLLHTCLSSIVALQDLKIIIWHTLKFVQQEKEKEKKTEPETRPGVATLTHKLLMPNRPNSDPGNQKLSAPRFCIPY